MSLDYPILPICQTAESFRNILSAMGPYRDSISLKKSPLLGLYTGSEAQLDLATVRYHALGAYAKSVYLVFGMLSCGIDSRLLAVSVLFVLTYIPESWFCLFISLMSRKKMIAAMANKMEAA